MSAGFSCHPILEVPVRTPETVGEDLDQHKRRHTDKLNKNPSHSERPTVRVRRPVKYLKHRGPRPTAASSPTFYWNISDSSVKVHQKSGSPIRLLSQNQERYSIQHNLKLERQYNKDNSNHRTNRNAETLYAHTTSRLLRSRKLKLSALNVSDLSSSSYTTTTCHSRFEVLSGDLNTPFNLNDIYQSKVAGMSRLSLLTPQAIMSCFSDGTTSAPNSSRQSLTISESSHSSFQPITSLEINRKKRISDGTLMLANNKSNPNHHTRSFSDFGISISSTTALKKLSG